MMRCCYILIAVLLGVSGASNAQLLPRDRGGAPEPPPEFRAEIERAERVGALLYELDQVAWKATDAALAEMSMEELGRRAEAWIVSKDSKDGWLVRFARAEDGGVFTHFDVPFEGMQAKELVPLDPPVPLEDLEVARFRAKLTAAREFRPLCNRPYNALVLPGSIDDRDGWLVYFLVSIVKDGEIPLAGHARAHVSADGERVLEYEPLSASCLVMDTAEAAAEGKDLEFVMASHILTSTPIETHTFISYYADVPILVATESGAWGVVQGTAGLLRRFDKDNLPSHDECHDALGEACPEHPEPPVVEEQP